MARHIHGDRYQITHHSEETFCFWCGSPLYVGDRVTMDPSGNTFCCCECRTMYVGDARDREGLERTA